MEKIKNNPTQPQEDENLSKETTPENEITVPVKYNKEIKNLSLDEASVLAQKGMKFDKISADFERVKNMAQSDGMSVTEFINALEGQRTDLRKKELLEKCQGDEELAEHILSLEKGIKAQENLDLKEVNEYFPNIKSINDLPKEVVENASMRGSALLDEYLRYRILKQRQKENFQKNEEMKRLSSIGSQRQSESPEFDPVKNEFIKGIWGN